VFGALSAFAAGLSAALLALAVVLLLLLRPLSATLQELCGAKERGDFWVAFCGVALTAGALLLGLASFWWSQVTTPGAPGHPPAPPEALFWGGVGLLRWSIAGIILGLAIIAALVASFTARMARGALPVPARPGSR
jgi:hypothetical protein